MKTKLIKLLALSTFLTMGLLGYSSSFNDSSAKVAPSLDNGRPLKSNGSQYCCENNGNDCGAACC